MIAVTGTNGKSTTTALIGHLLETCGRPVAVGGNIGRPALDLNMLGANGIYVLEMSSYQIDLTTTSIADVGVLLNITPDHLDRHGDMTNYIRAKRRLLEMQGPEDTAVIGVDDAESARIFVAMRGRGEQRVIPFSASRMVEDGVYVQNGALYDGTSGTALLVADLAQNPAFVGTHNWQNAAAAVAALAALGIRGEAVKEGLLTFAGLAHRQEPIAEISGVQFVNDSKATNPVSAVRALSCYDRVYWIAGGRAKEGGLEELNPYLERVTKAYLIGAAEEQFANHLDGRAIYEKCGTLDVAVAKAARDAAQDRVPNAVILLSPACASFDQYKNFEERGEAFRKLVNALSAQTDNAADNPAGVAAGGQAK